MSIKLNVKKISLIIITFFAVVCSAIILIHIFYKSFPARTHKTEANVLLVEGSLPAQALEAVKNEFQNHEYEKLIITGLNSTDDFFKVFVNGYLVFYPGITDSISESDNAHKIEVEAYSEWGGTDRAHFNFYINNTLQSDFFASNKVKKYVVKWQGKLEDIDSVMIQFDNDKYTKWEDINLYVKDITIDNKFTIPYLYNSAYDIGLPDWKRRRLNNYNSNAEQTRNELIRMGIDSARIIAVPGAKTNINRTLESVVTFRDWLKETDFPVNGINLISSGLHASRKHMIYKNILSGNYDVGVICLPEYKQTKRSYRRLNELREFFGTVYYWVVLKFY